jgi:hypothetical protein
MTYNIIEQLTQWILTLNPHLFYTTYCLRLHLSKWGASATIADKLIFIGTMYAPGINTKCHICPAHYFFHEIAESGKAWQQKK